MTTYFTKEFKSHYSKRIKPNKNLDKRFEKRYKLFLEDQKNPILRNHALGGKMKGFRSFSITGDIRVIYHILNNIAYFVDIGTHNQVY